MLPRTVVLALLASLATSCIPKEVDPNIADLDGDGIPDARDACMADPEDFDGYQDEDGCAEGAGPEDVATTEPNSAAPPPLAPTAQDTMATKKPLRLRRIEARATLAKVRDKAGGAVADKDERALVILGFGKAWLQTGSKTHVIRGDVHRVHFAPDGSHVALVGDREFVVMRVASGDVVARFPFAKGTREATETKEIRLGAGGDVVFFDGCQLRKATLGSKKTGSKTTGFKTTSIGKEHCGSRPMASASGKRWFLRSDGDEFASVREIRIAKGTEREVLRESGTLSLLTASPNGDTLCFSRERDGSKLTCREVATLKDDVVWEGPTDKRAIFLADGRLAFGGGPLRAPRDLYVADFERGTVRSIGALGARERWLSAVGESGLVASGGSKLIHFDLKANVQLSLALEAGEWEGFSAIPGSTSEFFVGKERKATRDLYRVRAP